MRDLIIAVDPGKTTGIAVYDATNKSLIGTEQIGDLYDTITYIEDWMYTTIVCESYTITPATMKKSRQNYSLEMIGVLRYLTQKHDAKFLLQTPAAAKSFSTDDKLKRLDWYVPGQDHANDALRHLLLYLATTNQINLQSLIG